MELTRIAGPAEPVITLEEAREHCRVDAWGSPPVHPDDALIMAYVQAATDELDGADAWLGRALVTQTWRLTLPGFPAGAIELPLTSPKPASSPPPDIVQAIAYVDADGATQTLDTAAYRVVSEADPVYVVPAFGTAWPATRTQADAVKVTYAAGYGTASAVPEIVKNYIRLRTGQLYAHREAIVIGAIVNPTPFVRDSLENVRARATIRRLINGSGQ